MPRRSRLPEAFKLKDYLPVWKPRMIEPAQTIEPQDQMNVIKTITIIAAPT